MATKLLLMVLPLVVAVKIQELKNPILPISLGKSYISNVKHTSLYHINISEVEERLSSINNLLININETFISWRPNKTFDYSVQQDVAAVFANKFMQTNDFYQSIKTNTKLFQYQSRHKRGLINIIGKVNKWLFGNLDSDDEQKFNNYFELLNNNQKTLSQDFKKEHTILTNVTQTYTEILEKLNRNEKIIAIKLKDLETSENNGITMLSLSLILDSVIMQLNSIDKLITNIETAISFAHVNTMHNLILSPKYLIEMINTIENIYGKDRVPKFNELINYYKYLSVQVIIKNDQVLFSIHTPIVLPKQFTLYKVYPIPILNQTISVPNPYILISQEDYWSSAEDCPNIEDYFICQQDLLSKDGLCLYQLLTTSKNNCPLKNIQFRKTTIERLNGDEILVIPYEEILIKKMCQGSLYKIKQPSLITLSSCSISIKDKIYEKEGKTEFQYVLNLPQFNYSLVPQISEEINLEEVNLKELNDAQRVLSTIKISDLMAPGLTVNHWIPSIFTILLISSIFSIYVIRRFWLNYKQRNNEDKDAEKQETRKINEEPLFSHLKEGGDM